MTYTQEQELALAQFAHDLTEAGFLVLLPDPKFKSWLVFCKNDKFGIVSASYTSGFIFATKHKPSQDFGTGHAVRVDVPLKLEYAEEVILFNQFPRRSRLTRDAKPKEYTSVEEFVKENSWTRYQLLHTINHKN